jgi:hypothetical protein
MQSDSICRASASEFPHDNPEFDRGALWIGSPLCRLTPAPPLVLEEETPEHSGVIARPADLSPASEPVDIEPCDLADELMVANDDAATLPPVVDMPAEVIEGRGAVRVEGAGAVKIEAAGAVPVEAAGGAVGEDPFARFVEVVGEIAAAYSSVSTGAIGRALLVGGLAALEIDEQLMAALAAAGMIDLTPDGPCANPRFATTVSAWRAVLRGEGDLALCGEQTLDAWVTDLVCKVASPTPNAASVRRDVRRRGIAAFGMID